MNSAAYLAASLLAACCCVQGAAADPQYRITQRIALPGDSGWDYLAADVAHHQLFVTRGDAVQVVDTRDGRLRGTIEGLHDTHGVAVSDDAAFISNGRSNSVTVVDLASLRVEQILPVTGKSPDAIVYEPALGRVYAVNHRSGDITIIDAATRSVVGTIPVLEEPEFAVSDGKGRLFVNSEAAGVLAVIDLHASRMTAQWKLGDCLRPTGLALDAAHARLFSVCANREMVVVDAAAGRVVAQVPIGAKPDAAAFDAALGMAYASNGDGTLTVVHEDDPAHFRVVTNLATRPGARTMALDPQSHELYLSSAAYAPAPRATPENPAPRPPVLPGSFQLLVVTPAVAP